MVRIQLFRDGLKVGQPWGSLYAPEPPVGSGQAGLQLNPDLGLGPPCAWHLSSTAEIAIIRTVELRGCF